MDPNKRDSNVLTYYMNRIYTFLTSPKTSQVFPGLTKDVEEILVKLAEQSDLKLQGFDDDFKELVSVIQSEIERKKCEYLLSCSFQEMACGNRSLIYTKTMIPIIFKQPQPLRKPNSMTSNTPPPPPPSDLITQSFKLRCLNATLKFIKDESRLSLRYPEMASIQAHHVVNMFEHSNSDGDLGLGYKTLYAPLWEAMKIFGLKYKFTLKYTDPKIEDMKCLVLEKIPIVHSSKNKENQDQNSTISLPNSSTATKDKIKIAIEKNEDTETFKKSKKRSKKHVSPKLIDALHFCGDEFMTGMYKRILDFIMDEASASLIFNNMSPEETQILSRWNHIMKTKKYQLLLSANCMFILSQLCYNYKDVDFSIVVCEGKKSKQDFKRNVTFTKVPLDGGAPNVKKRVLRRLLRRNERLTKKSNLKKSGSLTSLSSRSSVEMNSVMQSASQVSAMSSSASQVSANKSSASQVSASQASASKSSASEVSANKSSASQASASKSSASQASPSQVSANKTKIGNTKGNMSKMKLLEGLDQPVTCDKAMKMMLNMGWEGGALGARGEGLMEPIRPSLDICKRHGLGAPIEKPKPKPETQKPKLETSKPKPETPKPKPETPRKKSETQKPKPETPSSNNKQYHTESLKLILNLLTSTSNTKEITFPQVAMGKQWNYIKNMVILLNKGIKICAGKERNELVEKIVEILYETDWILTAGLKTDRMTIVIKKSILPLYPNELKLYCEIAALTESRIYNDGTFKDIYKHLHHRTQFKHVGQTPLNDLGNTKDLITKESDPKDQKQSDPKDLNQDTVKIEPLDNENKLINEKDSKIQTEDSKCINSDDDVQIIENEDIIITIIASSDESDLLKTDSEDDYSIADVITKLNDHKISSKEKSSEAKPGNNDLEKDSNNNLENDDSNYVKDNQNSVKESDNIEISETLLTKVEKDFENISISDIETSKEFPGKRSRSNSQISLQYPKRLKLFCKKIAIIPENYPQTKMDEEKAREIQTLLLDAINNHSELPLLKCHGIKNGTLIYSCHTENTFLLIEKIAAKGNLKISYEVVTENCNKKMAFKISTYIEESTGDILNRLVKFNEGLDIDNWIVVKKEQHTDFVVIFVNIDIKSYCYLKDVNFSLYAGVDVAIFTHVWD